MTDSVRKIAKRGVVRALPRVGVFRCLPGAKVTTPKPAEISQKNARFSRIARNLHQIYDTPIYQAWQTFRRKNSQENSVPNWRKHNAGIDAINPAILKDEKCKIGVFTPFRRRYRRISVIRTVKRTLPASFSGTQNRTRPQFDLIL